jgi:hypothetical protein
MAPPDDTHCPQDDASRAIGAGHEALAAENAAFPGTPDKSTKFLGNFLVDYIRVYPVQ